MAHGEVACEIVGKVSYCIPNGFFDFFGVQCSLLLLFPFLYAIRSNINDWFEAIIIGRLIRIAREKYGGQVHELVASVSTSPDENSLKESLENVDAGTRSESKFEQLLRKGPARDAIKLDGLSHVAAIICALLFALYMFYFWLLVSTGISFPSIYSVFFHEIAQEDSKVRILIDHESILRLPHFFMLLGSAIYLFFSCRLIYRMMEKFSAALQREFFKLKKWMVYVSLVFYAIVVSGLLAYCWYWQGSFTSWLLSLFIVVIIIISYGFVYLTFALYAMVLSENINGD